MYEYRDINEYAYPSKVSVQTIINGINLDEVLEGFITLSVKGRELVNRTDGELEGRTLVIEYALMAKNNKDFREQFEWLNYYLKDKDLKIIFTDDEDFYFTGDINTASEVDGNANHVKSIFEIKCKEAYKEAVEVERFDFTDQGTFKKQSLYPVKLEKIKITSNANTEKLILKNTTNGQRIILDNSFAIGDGVVIDFKNLHIETDEGQNLMTSLDITSDFEEFRINYNDQLQVDGAVEVFYREVRL